MIKFNTFSRVICTLAVVLTAVSPLEAQSVLNFTRGIQNGSVSTGIAVTNTSGAFADVEFAFYGGDGQLLSDLTNPISYRVPPKGQIAVSSSEIFGAGAAEGWIQVTSSTSGLRGSYFSGDFTNTLEGSGAQTPFARQIIPYMREGQGDSTTILLTNPEFQDVLATVTYFNARGDEVGGGNVIVPSRGQLPVPASGASALISASLPILANAIIRRTDSVMFVNGQNADQTASVRVIPHIVNAGGFSATVVLANPTASSVTVTTHLFSQPGGSLPASVSNSFVVPANGSVTIAASELTGLLISPQFEGWLRIDSPNVPLAGVAVLDSSAGMTAVPAQAAASERLLLSHVSDAQNFSTRISLVNPGPVSARLSAALIRADGSTVVQRDVTIAASSMMSTRIRDLVPDVTSQSGGFITIRSTQPLYSVETVGALNGGFVATISPDSFGAGFVPSPITTSLPRIAPVERVTDVRPGMQFRILTFNVDINSTFVFGDQVIRPRQVFPGSTTLIIDVPAVEPGFASLKVRAANGESNSIPLRVLSSDGSLTETLQGRALYEKVEVSDSGLNLETTVMVPIRYARVEVIDNSSQAIVSVSETDIRGRFTVMAPNEPDLTVRVVSRMRGLDLRVADNTNNNLAYAISADVDMRQRPSEVTLIDRSRVSGAFNILEVVQRGNDLIATADPRNLAFPVTIYWSVRNVGRPGNPGEGMVGTTFFSSRTNTAYILGDRSTDSDEFDDSVILHEYAHMLAVRFSRDDSPGGRHGVGDMLDPRVAWSEGWANFFSSAARNSAIYRDSSGPNGTEILRYDLEENVAPGDRPGYWSEHSVQSLLWDLFDEVSDDGDSAEFQFSSIWSAFADLRNDRYVYLPYYLERFLARNPSWADAVQNMVQLRAIDFQPEVRPSVTNPFPRPLMPGTTATGEVDSLTPRRTNLMQSAHFFSFTTPDGFVSLRLDIEGLGAGGTATANDLDLLLLDINGRIIERSDRGLNGQSELISTALPAGTYVVEVRSFYRQAETNTMVFNAGRYRLGLLIQ